MSFSPSKSCSRRNRPESGLIVISITESVLIRYKSNHLIENMVTVSRKNIQEKACFPLFGYSGSQRLKPLFIRIVPDISALSVRPAAALPASRSVRALKNTYGNGVPDIRHAMMLFRSRDLPVGSVRACNGTNFLPGRENRYSAIPADFRKRSYSATPISDTSRASRPSRRPSRPISRQPPRRNARSNRHR